MTVKPTIRVEEPVSLTVGEDREFEFGPDAFSALTVKSRPLVALHAGPSGKQLAAGLVQNRRVTETATQKFGIRTITQGATPTTPLPTWRRRGLLPEVNGKDFLVPRSHPTPPDLLYRTILIATPRSWATSRTWA